jgi:HlyD family secretion protein
MGETMRGIDRLETSLVGGACDSADVQSDHKGRPYEELVWMSGLSEPRDSESEMLSTTTRCKGGHGSPPLPIRNRRGRPPCLPCHTTHTKFARNQSVGATLVVAQPHNEHQHSRLEPRQNQSWRTAFLGLFLASSLLACAGESASQAAPEPKETKPQLTAVRVVTTQRGGLEARRTSSGVIAAATDSAVVAEQSGRVLRVQKRAGERIVAGETVMTLENGVLQDQLEEAKLAEQAARVNLQTNARQNPEDAAQAKKRLAAAQNAFTTSQRVLEANQKLYQMGGIAEVELRQSRTQLEQSRAELEAARAALARVERAPSEGLAGLRLAVEQAQTRVRQLERSLANSRVRAPYAGEIAEVFLQTGDFASAGSKAFRLVDPNSLRVNFSVPPSDAGQLTVGRDVRVRVGERVLEGRISRDARVAGETRLVAVQARFVGQPKNLSIGAAVQLEYRAKLGAGVLVPLGALRLERDKRFVYVVQNSKAIRRDVRVVAEANGRVAITGLEVGSSVVYPVPSGFAQDRTVEVIK